MNIFGALGTVISDIICYPLGGVMKLFFYITPNYALLLVLFTIVIRVCLFPLAVKQQRSSAETLRMKPKMDKLQKKYAKDQAKLQEEMSKLYSEEGFNPLSGCLPLLIQMPILFGLYQVVYNPLKYLMWFSQEKIDKIASVLRKYINSEFNVTNFNDPKIELYLAKAMKENPDKLAFLGHYKNIDFNLFGMDLSAVPKIELSALILIPILVYVSQALSSWLSIQMNKQIQQNQAGGGMNNFLMTFLLPLMSVWFSVTFPAAVGIYWIISNLLMVVQVVVLRKYFSLEKLAAQSEEKAEKRRQDIIDGKVKPSRMQVMAKRALEMQKQQNAVTTQDKQQISQKTQDKLPDHDDKEKSDVIKVNAKGKKSRSQIKDEQRKRLAQSRKKV